MMTQTPDQILIFASHNQGKLAEYQDLLSDMPVKIQGLSDLEGAPEVEEVGAHFSDNARIKAQTITEYYSSPAFADDSGLEVYALDGAPGVYSKRYAGEHASDSDNIQKLLESLKNVPFDQRRARFRTVICLTLPVQTLGIQDFYFEGELEGLITTECQGHAGFGYDPIFYVPELDMTFAEAGLHVKNAVSHRGKAFQQMKAFLEEQLPFDNPVRN